MLALVLPAEMAPHPDVGPAVAAVGLLDALLEGVPGAFRVGRRPAWAGPAVRTGRESAAGRRCARRGSTRCHLAMNCWGVMLPCVLRFPCPLRHDLRFVGVAVAFCWGGSCTATPVRYGISPVQRAPQLSPRTRRNQLALRAALINLSANSLSVRPIASGPPRNLHPVNHLRRSPAIAQSTKIILRNFRKIRAPKKRPKIVATHCVINILRRQVPIARAIPPVFVGSNDARSLYRPKPLV